MNADKNFNRRNVLVLEKLDVYAAMDYDCEEKIFADLRHQSTTLKAKSTEKSRKQWASTRQTHMIVLINLEFCKLLHIRIIRGMKISIKCDKFIYKKLPETVASRSQSNYNCLLIYTFVQNFEFCIRRF